MTPDQLSHELMMTLVERVVALDARVKSLEARLPPSWPFAPAINIPNALPPVHFYAAPAPQYTPQMPLFGPTMVG